MKYDLIGINGNAYCVMGYVARAMRECGKSETEIIAYYADAKSGDYNHLLAVSDSMVDTLKKTKRGGE
jgi:hypothetical protein